MGYLIRKLYFLVSELEGRPNFYIEEHLLQQTTQLALCHPAACCKTILSIAQVLFKLNKSHFLLIPS